MSAAVPASVESLPEPPGESAPLEAAFRPCVLIPTYDNPHTIEAVVRDARSHLPHVVVVDDGSHAPARGRLDALARDGLCHVHRRARNGGKGAAVQDGLRVAHELGFTHAVQVDADGQHALGDIPRFVAHARRHPDHLVLGQPVFDASVPKKRFYGRKLSIFWARVATFGDAVGDPLCGFRVYPVGAALDSGASGQRMDFDPEIAVRMAWRGTAVLRVPTQVHYFVGGVSHFQMFRDNVRLVWLHTRLVLEGVARLLTGRMRAHRLPHHVENR